jgi:hypothetical protein
LIAGINSSSQKKGIIPKYRTFLIDTPPLPVLEKPKDKPSGGESLSRWQSRTASEMQACLAGQALLFLPQGLLCNTPPREAETQCFRLLFIFIRHFPYN